MAPRAVSLGPHKSCRYCHDCDHYGKETRTCDYILRTKHRRPCRPGYDCTVKSKTGARPTWRDTMARDEEVTMCDGWVNISDLSELW